MHDENGIGDTVAYLYNPGGLNNQKLALLGLFTQAKYYNKPIVLPDLWSTTSDDQTNSKIPLYNLYDTQKLHEFAQSEGRTILDTAPDGDVGGWHFFRCGCGHIETVTQENRMNSDDISCRFFRALLPKIKNSEIFNILTDEIFNKIKINLVVQLRIEKDWLEYSDITLAKSIGDKGDYAPTFLDILQKIKNTLPNQKYILATCNEAALTIPKDEIRKLVRDKFSMEVYWKSDFLIEEKLKKLNTLDLSMLDFELAIHSENYIGTTYSTFSNLVSFEKYSRTQSSVKNHFVYNANGNRLLNRHDNGAFSDVARATK